MLRNPPVTYQRPMGAELRRRLAQPRRFIQVVAGPRQVGKTTLAHYLDLLAGAGMVRGLQKFTGDAARSRGSSPKLQVLNTALLNATAGLTPDEASGEPEYRGRLAESAVGAHLANAAASGDCELFY